MWRKCNPCALVTGKSNDAAAVGNDLATPQKVKQKDSNLTAG